MLNMLTRISRISCTPLNCEYNKGRGLAAKLLAVTHVAYAHSDDRLRRKDLYLFEQCHTNGSGEFDTKVAIEERTLDVNGSCALHNVDKGLGGT